jgi:hypothetical protein
MTAIGVMAGHDLTPVFGTFRIDPTCVAVHPIPAIATCARRAYFCA